MLESWKIFKLLSWQTEENESPSLFLTTLLHTSAFFLSSFKKTLNSFTSFPFVLIILDSVFDESPYFLRSFKLGLITIESAPKASLHFLWSSRIVFITVKVLLLKITLYLRFMNFEVPTSLKYLFRRFSICWSQENLHCLFSAEPPLYSINSLLHQFLLSFTIQIDFLTALLFKPQPFLLGWLFSSWFGRLTGLIARCRSCQHERRGISG